MNTLRVEADAALARAEEAEAKNKKYEQLILEKDQEITSLSHKLGLSNSDLEKADRQLEELKVLRQEGDHSKTTNDGLIRKIQLLEEELDAAEKNVKETVEKFVIMIHSLAANFALIFAHHHTDSDRWMSRPSTLNARSSGWSRNETHGKRSLRCIFFFFSLKFQGRDDTLAFHRNRKPNTVSPRRNWMNWFTAWRMSRFQVLSISYCLRFTALWSLLSTFCLTILH
jgi:tropomyosin, fungi type